MTGATPICDGHFGFDPTLMLDVRRAPDEAAALLGRTMLPDTIDVPVWCYLIKTQDGFGLIDSGRGAFVGGVYGTLRRALAVHGVTPQDIRHVWLTHLHGDHCGGLITPGGDAEFPQARIALPGAEAAYWLGGNLAEDLRPIADDARQALAPYAERTDRIESGDRVAGALAVAASGHTPGHMAWLFEEQRCLAAGDIFHVPELQIARPGWSTDWDHDPAAAAATRKALMRRAQSESLMLLTGHGGALSPECL